MAEEIPSDFHGEVQKIAAAQNVGREAKFCLGWSTIQYNTVLDNYYSSKVFVMLYSIPSMPSDTRLDYEHFLALERTYTRTPLILYIFSEQGVSSRLSVTRLDYEDLV